MCVGVLVVSSVSDPKDSSRVMSELVVQSVEEGRRGEYKCTASNTFGETSVITRVLKPSELRINTINIADGFVEKKSTEKNPTELNPHGNKPPLYYQTSAHLACLAMPRRPWPCLSARGT